MELHLSRVEEAYADYSAKGYDFWTIIKRVKAKKTFTNTTRALRMIMVFHHENLYVLRKMADRLKEKLELGDELASHYSYLLSQLEELEGSEAE